MRQFALLGLGVLCALAKQEGHELAGKEGGTAVVGQVGKC